MSNNIRIFEDITNKSVTKRDYVPHLEKPPFFRSERTSALINYYRKYISIDVVMEGLPNKIQHFRYSTVEEK